MKINAKNVVLIMSAGSGSRFGADKPKQYCLMNGKPIIEYALDVCRMASNVDAVVVVTSKDYVEYVKEQYGFPTAEGGENRTISLAKGLKYVAEHYNCEKVIIANAVCPLMTEEQINRYFDLLDEYDYVLTAWKVVSTLGRYDGQLVDRDDYFHVMEPEAYRFRELYENYKIDYPVPYIFHQLPKGAKGFYCFDYPYTMKITYSTDVKIAELLYKEKILKAKREQTLRNINLWSSSFTHDKSISKWLLELPRYCEELANKWEINSYTINPETFATCVFEGKSSKYGDVIIKFHAPSAEGRFDLELLYYQKAKGEYMAKLLDFDKDYRALLIEKIKPGLKVKFDKDDIKIKEFFENVSKNMITENEIKSGYSIPTIMDEFKQRIEYANRYNFKSQFIKTMNALAFDLWNKYFDNKPQYYLHRDLQRRNILRYNDTIRAIDPLGVLGPKEFEFTIAFVIESKANVQEYKRIHADMLDFFSQFCDKEALYAALFITWVHKMNEYVFVKHDDFATATMVAGIIDGVFFDNQICETEEQYLEVFHLVKSNYGI